MQFFDSLAAVPADFGPSAVAIGKFDGVHSGHRAVIATLGAAAAEQSLTATIVTFYRHPLSLLRPEACPEPLLSNAQKVERLAETGVDATLMVEFDRPFSQLSPEEFVRGILVDALHARLVFVGSDFRFGARGAGTVELLTELGATVVDVDAIYDAQADIYAPCALGATLNANTLTRLKASIIAGGANNQLATAEIGEQLRQKGVLYVPDFVINAGGIIKVCYEYLKKPEADVEAHAREIGDTLTEVFTRADKENRATSVVADEVAQARFQR